MQLKSSTWFVLVALFVVALSIRLCAVEWIGEAPQKDALQYPQIAVNIVSGNGYSLDGVEPTTLRPPVYPFFIAAIYALSGVDHKNTLIAQAVLNALLLFPLFWLAVKVSKSVAVGMATAVLFVLHTSFEIVTRLNAENMLILLMLAFIVLIYRIVAHASHRMRYAIAAGLLAGLMGLTKPEYSMLGLFSLCLALLLPTVRQYWKSWAVIALVSLLFVGGWQARNMLVHDGQQNRIASMGMVFANCPALLGDYWWPVTDMALLEEKRQRCDEFISGKSLPLLKNEIQDMWREKPLEMSKLVVNRLLLLWASPPVGTSMLVKIDELLRWPLLLTQYLFVSVALIFLIRLGLTRPEFYPLLLALVYMSSVYGLLHAIRRYGYPLVPELCLVFAYAVWLLYRQLSRSREGGGDGQIR